jgi:hypothetical protein
LRLNAPFSSPCWTAAFAALTLARRLIGAPERGQPLDDGGSHLAGR